MNAIVTGASKGIGYNTVLNLCKAGVNKIIAVSRNGQLLQKLKDECAEISPLSEIVVADIDLAKATLEKSFLIDNKIDRLDILINNAGVLINKPFELITSEDSAQIFDVNFHAPAKLIQVLLPLLKKSDSAHVINISSIGGFQGSGKFPGLSYYSASKAAVSTLTECLAEEYKGDNIKFNCLAFGAVQTEMLNKAFPDYQAPITAKEMGRYVADFALTGHKYYNGQVLPVRLSNP